MATSANALLPGRNPSGTNLAFDYSLLPSTGSTSGQNPVLPPTNLPSGAPATNTFDPTSVVPTFGANTGGGYSATSLLPPGASSTSPGAFAGTSGLQGLFSGMTQKGWNDFLHELNKTYGEGTASMIASFLQSGAGFNQNAINNLFAALQPGIERGTESLAEQFSTSGNRFGSGAQIGIADYLSQVQLNEGELETQMYEQSVNDFINTLMGVAGGNAKRIGSSPSILDTIGQGIGLASNAAGAISQGFGLPDQNILSIIGSL